MAVANAAPRERLNPFAFPSQTTFRFVLLIFAVLGSSFYMFNGLYFTASAHGLAQARAYARCLEEARTSEVEARARSPRAVAAARRSDAFQDCIRPTERKKAVWMLGGTALVVALAAALYLAFPAWKVRRRRLRPLVAGDAPEVLDELDELVREAGLERWPRFVWNPLGQTAGALAFGRLGRHYVALDGGLVVTFYRDRPAFRAIVLHELAHLRNRDVDVAYFTLATWWAFLAGAVAPYALTLLDEPIGYVFSLAWRLAALVVLVYVIRNGVLRARELYADARAFAWEGFAGALRRVLGSLPRRGGLARHLLGVHPDPEARVELLDDARPLFRIGFWESLTTGITATAAYANAATLLVFYSNDALSARWLAGLVFAPLAIGVVGLGVWRASYAALARREAPPSGTRLGLGLGLGFLLGQELSFFAAIPGDPGAAAGLLRFHLAWALVLVAVQILLVRWLIATATLAHEEQGGKRGRRVYPLALAVASAALVVALAWILSLRELQALVPALADDLSLERETISSFVWAGPQLFWTVARHHFVLLVVHHALTLPVVATLAVFPVAASLSRPRALRIRFALLVSLAGGAVFSLGHLTARIALRAAVPSETRGLPEYRLAFFVWTLVLALAVQIVVAAVAAAGSRRHAGIHALFASFVTGCLAAAAILLLNLAFGGSVDSPFFWLVTRQVLNEGALLALAGAGAGMLVGTAVRRLRPRRLRTAGAAS
ncbi:MAG: M48 family metalloprotease [Actinomycetota bacterium]|nr:M48 family metalloprotease [Actinomycetota bacterium]